MLKRKLPKKLTDKRNDGEANANSRKSYPLTLFQVTKRHFENGGKTSVGTFHQFYVVIAQGRQRRNFIQIYVCRERQNTTTSRLPNIIPVSKFGRTHGLCLNFTEQSVEARR